MCMGVPRWTRLRGGPQGGLYPHLQPHLYHAILVVDRRCASGRLDGHRLQNMVHATGHANGRGMCGRARCAEGRGAGVGC